jgi:hypothetical protein
MLCRNFLLKHVVVGKVDRNVEVTGERGIIRKQLLDNGKETRRSCKLKDRAIARALWGTRF